MKGQGEVRMRGQGKVRMKGQGKVRRVEACLLRHVPAENAADTPWRRAGNQADQSGADTEPLDTNHR